MLIANREVCNYLCCLLHHAVTYSSGVVRRAKANAVVTYTLVLINGNAVPANSSLRITSSLTSFPPQNITVATDCKLDMFNGTAFDPVTMSLPANRALVCSIPVTVTAAHIANTMLPGFAATVATSTTAGYATVAVPAVMLYTIPAITVSPSFAGTFAIGKHGCRHVCL
jgi:hypothetical protein